MSHDADPFPEGKDPVPSAGYPAMETTSELSADTGAAFARWVEPEIATMLRVAYRLTGSWHDAEDIVQETLIRAVRAIDGFDGRHPRAWLLTILRRAHLNSLRRTRPRLVDASTLAEHRPAFGGAVAASPQDVLDDRLLDSDIEQALADLGATFRTVVLLVDVDQLTYAEAADLLDVPLGTVMSRLSRGRARLRKQLSHRRPFTGPQPSPDPTREEPPG